MGNYFGYMRISTAEERGKQKFKRQEAALEKYAKEHNITKYNHIEKEDISGKSFENRPGWQNTEALVHSGDTIVFKDLSRFTREAEAGYTKYMKLMRAGVNLVFIDNPTISTDYIEQMLHVAEQQDLIPKTALENTVKLLLIVELDRCEKERLTLQKRIIDGIKASDKRSGRKPGSTDKLTPELKEDIKKYMSDRSVKQVDLMSKYNVSRNTLKKYIGIVQDEINNAATAAN